MHPDCGQTKLGLICSAGK